MCGEAGSWCFRPGKSKLVLWFWSCLGLDQLVPGCSRGSPGLYQVRVCQWGSVPLPQPGVGQRRGHQGSLSPEHQSPPGNGLRLDWDVGPQVGLTLQYKAGLWGSGDPGCSVTGTGADNPGADMDRVLGGSTGGCAGWAMGSISAAGALGSGQCFC